MKHLMKSIAIILTILFGSTIAFSFQNEPDGFRGIKWGSTDEIGGKSYELVKDEEKFKTYKRKFEDRIFYRNGIEVKAMGIYYNTFDSKFMTARILCKISDWDSMKKILISLHGSPQRDVAKDDVKWVEWAGQKTKISMLYKSSYKNSFRVDLLSNELSKEYSVWKKAKKSERGGGN